MLAAGLVVSTGAGCSGGGADPVRPPGGGSTGGGTNNPGAGGKTSTAQGGGQITVTFGGSVASGGMDGIGGGCVGMNTPAKLLPLDLYVMMDSSKSMLEATTAGASKWKAVTDALAQFFKDANSSGLSVGLKFFPDVVPTSPATCKTNEECGTGDTCQQRRACVTMGTSATAIGSADLCPTGVCPTGKVCETVQTCGGTSYCVASAPGVCAATCTPFEGYCEKRDVCDAATYAAPAVPFGELPGSAQPLVDALAARMPAGYTPTGPALTGALQQAKARATMFPEHKVAVVLVTDGLPGGFIPNNPPAACVPADIAGISSTVLAPGATTAPAIPTFVIGVFGPKDLVDMNVMPKANLDALAKSGGTNEAVIISTDKDVAVELQNALKVVRTSAIACEYTIPPPPEGQLNFSKVNVAFTRTGMPAQTLVYRGGTDDSLCHPTEGGWHYDKDPMTAIPTKILVCPQSCMAFQGVNDGAVNIQYGCDTVVPR